MRSGVRVLCSFLPLVLSVCFGFLLLSSLNMGGGEKDVFLALPLVL
jgi:hypothetical protein